MRQSRPAAICLVLALSSTLTSNRLAPSAQIPKDATDQVDQVFAKWTTSTPGCAIGVEVCSKPILTGAYGMADLEHDVRNTPETIFEAGSVSKQFTAAAVLLLAGEGKLSLDDPVRKYLPELPDYGVPVTIRQMLSHTSGLRDWGSVAAIAGWPRTTRLYTEAHVLDIVSRQRALNFAPGTQWSYSNTGYTLAAIIVSRVSGMPFAEFTRQRIFEPLRMTHTSWRDDHSRIVKGRALAYAEEPDGYHTRMPFEDVHGNGGLLTTVGDLLKWNEHLSLPAMRDRAWVAELQQVGHLNDGREHGYGLGLFVGRYRGTREISHRGRTAAYTAFLTRFPDQGLSVALLCNTSSAPVWDLAHAVAATFLQDLEPSTPAPPKAAVGGSDIGTIPGVYRNTLTGAALTVLRDTVGIRLERGAILAPLTGLQFVTDDHRTWDFSPPGLHVKGDLGDESYERVTPATPTPAQLQEYIGRYRSDEAETVMMVAFEDGALVLKRRPDTNLKLTPTYRDAFNVTFVGTFGAPETGTVIFRRDNAGRIEEFTLVQERIWDLRFKR